MDKATSNHAFCSTDTPTSVSLSCFSCFSWLNNPSAPSCPFVSLRVHSCAFVVHTLTQGAPTRAIPALPSPPSSLLLPPPFSLPDGSPLHSVPALPSPPSSLLPMKNHSCPFVAHISLRHFVPFVVFVGRKNGGRLDLLFREVGSNHWTCRQSRRLPNQEDTTMSRPTRFNRLPMYMFCPYWNPHALSDFLNSSSNCRPKTVSLYFCKREFGLPGIVNSM